MQAAGAGPRPAGPGALFVLLFTIALAQLPMAHATTSYWTTNSIAFAAGRYTVSQAQGVVAVTVTRSGNCSEAASIQYASANSTAVAGRDYAAANGQLSWAAGDGGARTISVAVKKSPGFTGTRTLNLWLQWISNASYGSRITTEIVIDGVGSSTATPMLQISGTPSTIVNAGSGYLFQPRSSAPTGATVAFSITNKPSWASFSTVSGALSGTPPASAVGTASDIVISASDGVSTAALPAFSLTVKAIASAASETAERPAYNTGDGFFVLNGTLYDPNGNAFRIRGVNRLHWDSDSAAGLALSGANTVRTFIDFTRPATSNVSLIQTDNVDNKEVPVVTYNGTQSSTSCTTDPSVLNTAVSFWTSQASSWTTLNRYLIVNVANEWGAANSIVWRDSYVSAIAQLRQAGYSGPILIDSGGCGQDDADLLLYSGAVFNSDPERNVVFAIHLYGTANDYSASIQSITKGDPTVITLASDSPTHPFAPGYNGSNNSWSGINAYQISGVQGMTQLNGTQPASTNVGGVPGAWTVTLAVDSTNWGSYTGGGTLVDYNGNYALRIARLAALSEQTGAVYVVAEFGPGNNVGPSPTMVTPAQIISAAEANGIGWMPWAWDDNDLPNGMSNNAWFSMTYSGPGIYTQPSDLTNYGQDVVLNPSYGLSVLAKRATIF
jgi:hypothetical protein